MKRPPPSSAEADDRLVTLARLGKAHGLKGEVKLDLLGRTGEALERAARVYVGTSQLDARRMEVEALRGGGSRPILKLREVSSPEEARALAGSKLFLPRRDFPPAAEGEYYWADLVGLAVKADGELLGRLEEILETPAFDVLVVRAEREPGREEVPEERLIPFTGAALREVRLDEGVVLVHPPEVWEAEAERPGEERRETGRSGGALRIDLLTLFPGIFDSPFEHSLLAKARARGIVDIRVHDLREEGEGRHRVADDAPYGGGDGMVMLAGPVVRSIERVRGRDGWVVLLSPAGALLDQRKARELAGRRHLVIVCGRYGGIDERVSEAVDEEISVGDYVLGGGEPAAIVLVDAVARLVPGVVGNADSTAADSFEDGLLECPQFTRPESFRDRKVPEALLSGDHARVARWRRKESIRRTLLRRPDLIARARLSNEDLVLLAEVEREEGRVAGKAGASGGKERGRPKRARAAKGKGEGRP